MALTWQQSIQKYNWLLSSDEVKKTKNNGKQARQAIAGVGTFIASQTSGGVQSLATLAHTYSGPYASASIFATGYVTKKMVADLMGNRGAARQKAAAALIQKQLKAVDDAVAAPQYQIVYTMPGWISPFQASATRVQGAAVLTQIQGGNATAVAGYMAAYKDFSNFTASYPTLKQYLADYAGDQWGSYGFALMKNNYITMADRRAIWGFAGAAAQIKEVGLLNGKFAHIGSLRTLAANINQWVTWGAVPDANKQQCQNAAKAINGAVDAGKITEADNAVKSSAVAKAIHGLSASKEGKALFKHLADTTPLGDKELIISPSWYLSTQEKQALVNGNTKIVAALNQRFWALSLYAWIEPIFDRQLGGQQGGQQESTLTMGLRPKTDNIYDVNPFSNVGTAQFLNPANQKPQTLTYIEVWQRQVQFIAALKNMEAYYTGTGAGTAYNQFYNKLSSDQRSAYSKILNFAPNTVDQNGTIDGSSYNDFDIAYNNIFATNTPLYKRYIADFTKIQSLYRGCTGIGQTNFSMIMTQLAPHWSTQISALYYKRNPNTQFNNALNDINSSVRDLSNFTTFTALNFLNTSKAPDNNNSLDSWLKNAYSQIIQSNNTIKYIDGIINNVQNNLSTISSLPVLASPFYTGKNNLSDTLYIAGLISTRSGSGYQYYDTKSGKYIGSRSLADAIDKGASQIVNIENKFMDDLYTAMGDEQAYLKKMAEAQQMQLILTIVTGVIGGLTSLSSIGTGIMDMAIKAAKLKKGEWTTELDKKAADIKAVAADASSAGFAITQWRTNISAAVGGAIIGSALISAVQFQALDKVINLVTLAKNAQTGWNNLSKFVIGQHTTPFPFLSKGTLAQYDTYLSRTKTMLAALAFNDSRSGTQVAHYSWNQAAPGGSDNRSLNGHAEESINGRWLDPNQFAVIDWAADMADNGHGVGAAYNYYVNDKHAIPSSGDWYTYVDLGWGKINGMTETKRLIAEGHLWASQTITAGGRGGAVWSNYLGYDLTIKAL